MKPLTFIVPGQPQGKGRPKIVKIGGFSRMATPQKTVFYENLVAHAAGKAMAAARQPLLEGPLEVVMAIDCQVPASWSGKKQRMALAGEIHPTSKPDIDNVVKAIFDGCNGVVWKDDVQVIDVAVRKRYTAAPRVQVWVQTAEQPVEQGELVQTEERLVTA